MAKKKETLEELLEKALVKEEDRPYEVPGNWVWTRLGNICSFENGFAFKSDDYRENGIPLVRISNIADNGVDISNCVYIQNDNIPEKFIIKRGDLLIAMSGATTGKNGVYSLDIPAYLNQRVGNIKLKSGKMVKEKFRNYYIMDKNQEILRKAYGGAQPNISGTLIGEFTFPLPPLPEQQRIIDVIESLFEKLDRAKELVESALDSFQNRKAAILHKAFTGELTAKWREENGTDAPSEMFDIIKKERMEMNTCSKDVLLLFNNYVIEDITDSNNWLRLKAMVICDNITCGGTPTGHVTDSGEIPFLKVYNIVNNNIDFKYKPQFINININEGKLKSSRLKPGDVVMNIVGPPLRKIAIIPDTYQNWNMNQAIVRFRTVPYVNNKYMYYCLINNETLDAVIGETKGVVGQANISITQSRNLEIPIPPIQEQQEIVRILDSLLEKEEKGKELSDVLEKIELMKKAILARAFRGELRTNNPEEESAVELLKEILSSEV